MTTDTKPFVLPPSSNAAVPPERRGLRRDHVRLMVLDRRTGERVHTRFFDLDRFLHPGDVLVLNKSRTLPAVLKADLFRNGVLASKGAEIRLSRRLSDGVWQALAPVEGLGPGDRFLFSPGLSASVEEVDPDRPFAILRFSRRGEELNDAIYRLGEPVRYEYIREPWDLEYYQTLYGSVPGSVEMPSAGRAFSWELLFKLRRKGIRVAFIVLHTGLSYPLEERWQLPPQENWEAFVVPEETVEIIRKAQSSGNRVIAAGTTVVRALESAADSRGLTPRSGWTNLYIDEKFSPRVVDGLITGFHEPEASHLDLLTAFVDRRLLYEAYREAIRSGYLWHEFGDANLIL